MYQEDIITINICAPNIRAQKYMKKALTELKGDIVSFIIMKEISIFHFQ